MVRCIDLQTGKENPPVHHIEIGIVRVETCNGGFCNWSHSNKAFLPSENWSICHKETQQCHFQIFTFTNQKWHPGHPRWHTFSQYIHHSWPELPIHHEHDLPKTAQKFVLLQWMYPFWIRSPRGNCGCPFAPFKSSFASSLHLLIQNKLKGWLGKGPKKVESMVLYHTNVKMCNMIQYFTILLR